VKAQLSLLVTFAVAATLASAAAGGHEAAKQRVAIDMAGGQSFALYPLQAGVLKRDSGLSTENHYLGRSFKRQGQQVSTVNLTYTLSGKQGSLTIRERNEWVDVSQKNARGFDYRPGVAIRHGKAVVHSPGGLPHLSLVR
jgi:hypothetical protein